MMMDSVELRFIEPSKPTQNAFVKSFNGMVLLSRNALERALREDHLQLLEACGSAHFWARTLRR